MSWTDLADVKAQLSRRWQRGELLRPLVTAEHAFPLRLRLKAPTASELSERFEDVRAWVAALAALPQLRLDWRELRHRVLGQQRLPQAIWVDSLDDAVALIGRRAETRRFEALVALTRAQRPQLLGWLGKRPLQALELADDWERLLGVVDWVVRHPRPGCYLRQVDIPGVHSKFIEAHRAVLAELLDLCLPPTAIVAEQTGIGRFAARYGFRDKPVRIRFRLLDTRIQLLPGVTSADITLDAECFAGLKTPIRRAFITENEINFLAFPPLPEAMVIFGAGYGWDALAQARWLQRCELHYWGDIDTHGFAILDQLRGQFPSAASFLMDRATLMAHAPLWGEEPEPVLRDLPRLTEAERSLFDTLRDNRIRKGLRLEQERIGFRWVEAALARLDHQPA
ncbi:hypothetical protein F2Q65_01155 [Thiohalocapsa marina]|uniref:DUF3322 and DUF2220 domain-containing protein n=1 Tax=Thiohalocapsa marina TaxID=424902 RepID=A0A5M8FVR8_9GAMM|nr:DUF3322 domain-containing protein [Thiohalocapsa marina]KAA6187875.1 hypothetical protein F2Q65_01155 [Thiohalocapsa marina]